MKRHSKNFIRVVKEKVGSPKFGCEVGVWKGGNSRNLLLSFPGLTLLMVDLYREHEEASRKLSDKTGGEMNSALMEALAATEFAGKRRMMMVSDSTEASEIMPDCYFDFVFIDADHSYEGVTEDLHCWTDKVSIGGIIGGHDYGGMGDRRGRFGVKKAVDKFFAEEFFGDLKVHNEPGLVWWVQKK